MTISVLIVDDHAIFRKGIATLLKTDPNLCVVGEAGDGKEALDLAERLHPQVMVMDCVMPVMDGLEATRRLHQQHPDIYVVMLSMHVDEAYVLTAIKNGASGYITKEDIVTHLVPAVLAVAGGNVYFSPDLRGLVTRSNHVAQDIS